MKNALRTVLALGAATVLVAGCVVSSDDDAGSGGAAGDGGSGGSSAGSAGTGTSGSAGTGTSGSSGSSGTAGTGGESGASGTAGAGGGGNLCDPEPGDAGDDPCTRCTKEICCDEVTACAGLTGCLEQFDDVQVCEHATAACDDAGAPADQLACCTAQVAAGLPSAELAALIACTNADPGDAGTGTCAADIRLNCWAKQ